MSDLRLQFTENPGKDIEKTISSGGDVLFLDSLHEDIRFNWL